MNNAATTANIDLFLGAEYAVTTTREGWVEVRPANPTRDKLDFIRVAEDDGTYNVYHLTHNAVQRGQMNLGGSMVGMLPGIVREMAETIW